MTIEYVIDGLRDYLTINGISKISPQKIINLLKVRGIEHISIKDSHWEDSHGNNVKFFLTKREIRTMFRHCGYPRAELQMNIRAGKMRSFNGRWVLYKTPRRGIDGFIFGDNDPITLSDRVASFWGKNYKA